LASEWALFLCGRLSKLVIPTQLFWPRARVTAHCSAADLNPNLACGVPGHTIHPPRSDRARAMVRRHSSRERRDEGEGRIRITRRGRIAGSRNDKRLAEKALHAKKLKPSLAARARTIRQPTGRKAMEWFSRKTSIAGIQISNWMIVLGAVIVILLIYNSMH
jgi:hypothetical protein